MIKWFEKYSKISWVITLFWGVAIFYISSLRFGGVSSALSWVSIVYHFSAFFCFSFFLLISSVRGRKNNRIFILVILISVFYGILDELHQFFVPGRACTFFDVGIDSLGILFASMIYFIRLKYKSNNSKGFR